jgi:hypothetical protein
MDLLEGDIGLIRDRAKNLSDWHEIEEYFLQSEDAIYDAKELIEPYSEAIISLAEWMTRLDLEIEQHGTFTFKGDFVSAARWLLGMRRFPHTVDDASILAVLAAFAAYESLQAFADNDERFGFMRLVDALAFLRSAHDMRASAFNPASEIGRKGGQAEKRSEALWRFIAKLHQEGRDRTPSVLWKKAIKLTEGEDGYLFEGFVIRLEGERLYAYPNQGEALKSEGRPIGFSTFQKKVQELNREK